MIYGVVKNYFFQYSYNVKMRLSAIKSGDSYQIRAERILIPTLCPFWAPDSQFGHRVPNWAPNRPTSESPSKKLDRQELTFKQLSSSSYISTMNFMKDDKVDAKYLPTKLWKADRVRLFQNTRMKVGTHAGKLKSIRRESKKRPRLPIFPLPEPYDFEAWQKIIFGKTVPYVDFEDRKREEEQLSSQESSKQVEENLEFADRILDIDKLEHGMPPVLRVVLRLTSHQISGLFDLFAELIEANQALQLALAEWIFAVLCVQQTPYEPAIASRIRAICRNCRKVRFQIVDNGEADSRKQELTSLNFIILLISNFFDQKDLSD